MIPFHNFLIGSISLIGWNQMAQLRRIYKSLAIVMCVIFFLYFSSFAAAHLLIPMLTNDPQMALLYFRMFRDLFLLAGAINAPTLYFCRFEN
jgi:hypothetical protein